MFIITLIIGLIIGGLARAIMPGDDSMNIIHTMMIGVGGSFLGEGIANIAGMHNGWILSIGCAILILILIRLFKGQNVL